MSLEDRAGLTGIVVAELFDGATGELKARHRGKNLVTTNGDAMLVSSLVAGYPAATTGEITSYYLASMTIGQGSTTPSKTGAGSALVTSMTAGRAAFDNTGTQSNGVIVLKATWTAGIATTASPITEVVLSNVTTNTSSTSETFSRALIAGISAKTASDVLVISWTITALGA